MATSCKIVSVMLVVLCLCQANPVSAQVNVFGGLSYTGVRNKVLENDHPVFSWHMGGGITLTPHTWSKFSVALNGMLSKKGYEQHVDTHYRFHFYYASFQPAIEYTPASFVSLQAGLDGSILVWTGVKKGMTTYNILDGGLVLGFTLFPGKDIAFYTKVVYGLTHMLRYYRIDEFGNFTGEIRDLKNTSLLAGIRVRVYHGKIPR